MNDPRHQHEPPRGLPWRTPVSRRTLFALAGGAVLAACSKGGDGAADTTAASSTSSSSTSSSTSTSSTSTTIPPTTTTEPPPVEPLTGRPLQDEALLDRAALVVKISNDRRARPQTGLLEADVVFEAWGAGPTRFAAVFHSTDADFVGPIRSCREQDVNLVGGFNRAVFACSGGNKGNLALLRNSDMLLITEGQGPGWQLDPNRGRPHKTRANTAELRSNAGPDRSAPVRQFRYRAAGDAPTQGTPAQGFDLQIQSVFVQWRYDAESKQYLRAQDGGPHVMDNGDVVSTHNVIVLWLDYEPSSTDGRSPDGRSVGGGSAVVFTGGRMIEGRWARKERTNRFTIVTVDGDPVELTPGRTFIELPNSGKGSFRGNDVLTPAI